MRTFTPLPADAPRNVRFLHHRYFRVPTRMALVCSLICGVGAMLFFLHRSPVAHADNSAYYVDCSASANGSGSQASPWNSLASVNNHSPFQPGDAIYFLGGVTCTGKLAPQGSGSSSAPIVIGSYGPSGFSRGIISGAGVQPAAVYLNNQQYWDINYVEVSNALNNSSDRAGIRVDNATGGTLSHIHIVNNYVHDVAGYLNGYYGDNGGIVVNSVGTSGGSQWDDVLINNNSVKTVYRVGIFVGQDTMNHTDTGAKVNESTRVVIQNNDIDGSGGDGIIVYRTSGALVQNNVVANSGARVSSACQTSEYCNPYAAGIWTVSSDSPLVQGNEVYNQSGGGDGEGYDCDWGSHNAIFQDNYSHDNAGGFMLFVLQDGINPIIRDNISQNDKRWLFGLTNGTGDLSSGSVNIYNNSLFTNASAGSVDLIGSAYGSNFSTPLLLTNNIVERHGGGGFYNDAHAVYDHNLFFGNATSPGGTNTIINNPSFANPDGGSIGRSTAVAYRLQNGSPALGSGAIINNAGSSDFFGNPLAAPPNRGAYQGTGVAGGNFYGQHKIQIAANNTTLDLQSTTDIYTPCNCGAYNVAATPDSWNTSQQVWTLVSVGGNQYKVQIAANNTTLDLQSTTDIYTPCNCGAYNVAATPDSWNTSQQVWTLVSVGGNQYKLQIAANNTTLDLQSTTDVYTPCNCGAYNVAATPDSWNTSQQLWTLV